ncbi:MAG TPA: hypothetical protein VFI47_30090 [Acidimicrobiales bacterium]|nr:hypothetical protein [Acidimicrobiales bacterium]
MGVASYLLMTGCGMAQPPGGNPSSTTTTSAPTTTTTTSTTTTTAPSTTTTAPSTTTTSSTVLPPQPDGTITRVTNGAVGQASGDSEGPAISADGRYIAFSSSAPDLVSGDTNGVGDVFVWDRGTSTMTRITDGDRGSHSPAISADGRYIAFASSATDLVAGDVNGVYDVFLWDATSGTTTRITDGNGDSWGASISGDGRQIAFESAASNLVPGDSNDTNDKPDIFVWEADTGTTTRITDSANASYFPAISADGGHITFYAFASNEVPDDTNGWWDVFVWEVETGTTTRITDGNENSLDPTISADGRYVTFWSAASNLVSDNTGPGLFLWDATTGAITRVTNGGKIPRISADGRYVVYNRQGDTSIDVWVWDATTGTSTNITHGTGHSSGGSISEDGNAIAFASRAFDLVRPDDNGAQDIFLWERTGT